MEKHKFQSPFQPDSSFRKKRVPPKSRFVHEFISCAYPMYATRAMVVVSDGLV